MWWVKLKIMFWTGLLFVLFGFALRVSADSLSRDIGVKDDPDFHSVRHVDPVRYWLFTEIGTWMMGFGVLTLALTLNQWVSGDPKRENSPPQN